MVPLGVCSLGGVSVVEEKAFMNGRQAEETVVSFRKLRRVCFDIIVILSLKNLPINVDSLLSVPANGAEVEPIQ